MKKSHLIILISSLFLVCSCFPEAKSSNSSETSSSTSPTSTPTSNVTTDYSSNPYIGTGASYSKTQGGVTISYSFNPSGNGVYATSETVDGQEVKETKEFNYTLKSETTVEYVLKETGDKGVGNFTTTQTGQALVVLGVYFYRT